MKNKICVIIYFCLLIPNMAMAINISNNSEIIVNGTISTDRSSQLNGFTENVYIDIKVNCPNGYGGYNCSDPPYEGDIIFKNRNWRCHINGKLQTSGYGYYGNNLKFSQDHSCNLGGSENGYLGYFVDIDGNTHKAYVNIEEHVQIGTDNSKSRIESGYVNFNVTSPSTH